MSRPTSTVLALLLCAAAAFLNGCGGCGKQDESPAIPIVSTQLNLSEDKKREISGLLGAIETALKEAGSSESPENVLKDVMQENTDSKVLNIILVPEYPGSPTYFQHSADTKYQFDENASAPFDTISAVFFGNYGDKPNVLFVCRPMLMHATPYRIYLVYAPAA